MKIPSDIVAVKSLLIIYISFSRFNIPSYIRLLHFIRFSGSSSGPFASNYLCIVLNAYHKRQASSHIIMSRCILPYRGNSKSVRCLSESNRLPPVLDSPPLLEWPTRAVIKFSQHNHKTCQPWPDQTPMVYSMLVVKHGYLMSPFIATPTPHFFRRKK